MLPAGLWFDSDGKRRVNDKMVEMARLAISPEDAAVIAENKRRRSPQQANLLDLLCSFEALPSHELMRFTGASRQSLKSLCTAELVELYQREVYRRPQIHAEEAENDCCQNTEACVVHVDIITPFFPQRQKKV